MELWIRSQSKEELIKVHNVSINKENYILGNLISDDNKSICDYWILGMYDTKERALEVLDEIQEMIKPTIITTDYECKCEDNPNDKLSFNLRIEPQKTTIQELSTYVYEMPED